MEKADTDKTRLDLWPFMLSVYARPGIAAACLRLQEAHGLDIPLMLAVLHGGVSGRVPGLEQIQAFDRNCRIWREAAILPLREARRTMKSHQWLASQPRVPSLREHVKAAELEAERVEADVLEQMLSDILPGPRLIDLDGLSEITVTVLDLYDPGRTERVPPEVNTIVAAVLQTVE
ncbi:TIGR02444 family protein [Mesorhizobium retamae]|uniref:TIGR02444 family protein n=1 Tax=Mesorhizobium retamae TaxID=2912854 RepID=A0ABS9QHG2_9HYPH|nr:TIGR02444 family protein [Mesorhizobium sp. IRAMC:0171]MCG7506883.1 TIGR02444 family protein [Mesorhizobium sp. IRAMC:0171]